MKIDNTGEFTVLLILWVLGVFKLGDLATELYEAFVNPTPKVGVKYLYSKYLIVPDGNSCGTKDVEESFAERCVDEKPEQFRIGY